MIDVAQSWVEARGRIGSPPRAITFVRGLNSKPTVLIILLSSPRFGHLNLKQAEKPSYKKLLRPRNLRVGP